ncbi:RNA polymerase sigma factor [Nitrospira sp. Kam-Ns4a]
MRTVDSLNPMKTHTQGRGAGPFSATAEGSEAADFDRLYRDHVDRVYRFAQRVCGQAEDAKDLVQETFLNAYRGLKQFRGDAQLSTWLYTIATRACLRMRRKRKGEPERELSLEEFIPTSEGEFRLQVPTDGLSPEEALANKQLRRALHLAIQKLPPKYRLVLILRDMEGLSAKEVGSIMGLTERAVKSRLHRARLFVRRELSARGIGKPGQSARARTATGAREA